MWRRLSNPSSLGLTLLFAAAGDGILLNDCAICILDPLRIRTNLMLTDHFGRDLGSETTPILIQAFLTQLGWQPIVHEAIRQPDYDQIWLTHQPCLPSHTH
jgi:hypothetical protein